MNLHFCFFNRTFSDLQLFHSIYLLVDWCHLSLGFWLPQIWIPLVYMGNLPTSESKSTSSLAVKNVPYLLPQSPLHLGHTSWAAPFRSLATASDLEASKVMLQRLPSISIGGPGGRSTAVKSTSRNGHGPFLPWLLVLPELTHHPFPVPVWWSVPAEGCVQQSDLGCCPWYCGMLQHLTPPQVASTPVSPTFLSYPNKCLLNKYIFCLNDL